jgi:tRNA (guanine-N(7)-)-methyltransferase
VTLALCAEMLVLGNLATDTATARMKLQAALDSGAAAEKFARMVVALGGPADLMERPEAYLTAAPVVKPVAALRAGVITTMSTRDLGVAIVELGGGRRKAGDAIDMRVGFSDVKPLGTRVAAGDQELRGARRPHGHGADAGAGRTGAEVRAALPAHSAPAGAAVRPRRRRWCWRSASAWATPPPRSPRPCRQVDFLGCEVHEPGVGALLKLIDEQGIGNIRIVQHDAVEVLEHMIAPDSLAGVHIFFPDPWHKKRHNKRRLIQPTFVKRLLGRPLAPGGYLHCATDWEPYAEQMLEVLGAEPQLENTAEPGYAPKPAYRPADQVREPRPEAGPWRVGSGVQAQVLTQSAASPATRPPS